MKAAASQRPIRVLLVDDHTVLLAGLRALLDSKPDIEVVGTAVDGEDAIRQVDLLRPDMVVMDISMPGMDGLEATKHITANYLDVRVLILTMYSDEQYLLRVLKAGGSGFVPKSGADVELINAIRDVYAGKPHLNSDAVQVLLDQYRLEQPEDRQEPGLGILSEREIEVLSLTAQGYTSREIGEKLVISPKTVDTYRQRFMEKLGLRHRVDLVQYALRNGLLGRSGLFGSAADSSTPPAGQLRTGFTASFSNDVKWDRTSDVIVVGSGTGLVTAFHAARAGLRVLVLEKASSVGGTTALSGGGIWIPNNYLMKETGIQDSREDALCYLQHATRGQSEAALLEAFVDNCNVVVDSLREIGIEWAIGPIFQDYCPELPGGKPNGRCLWPLPPTPHRRIAKQRAMKLSSTDSQEEVQYGNGLDLIQRIQQAAEEHQAEFLFDTPARRLVLNESGDVVGVIAETQGKTLAIKANRAVVLATGSFDHNKAMVNDFLRGPLYYTSAVEGNCGDGHLMGMAIGAHLRHMNERWSWPVYYDADRQMPVPAIAPELGRPGAIVVNQRGQRIMNEAGPYDIVTRAFYTFDTGSYEYVNIPSVAIIDSNHRRRYSFASFPPEDRLPDWISQADTLADLACQQGIDADRLAQTVASFNRYASTGVDPDFHRGESAFDIQAGGDTARPELKNPCMAPLTEPPFYATPIWPGSLGTCGGLQINAYAQVLDVWGDPIPGLYAVGNVAGSPFAGAYPGGGGTISLGMTFAYIAANHIIDVAES